ncbi:armadillo-like helical domain-containing protein 2 [Oculina patagonica]
MDWITRTFKAGFEEFKERTSVGVTHLEDVGALVDDNLFERDILIATKKLASSSNIPERTQAVKDLGHLSWSGGPSAAKFAGNQLVNLLSVLNNPSEPTVLKMFTIQAISEICCANKENQDKARCYGLIEKLTEVLSTTEPELSALRRSSAACLLTLACENLENQKTLLGTNRLQDYLTSVSAENWTAWEENEAAQLITFLGLDHSADQGSRWAKIRALGASLGGETPQH